jgi:hypothetical protein
MFASDHKIQHGKCIQCGCDANAIDYFGWSCSARTIQHQYRNDTCINCGFCRMVIEHFDWPCRLERRAGAAGDDFHQSYRGSGEGRAQGNDTREPEYSSWRYMSDEIRYARLLGLRGKVTKWDIKCAYRQQANLYHPDRVAHLAPDIQELATEKMKDINLAFAYFHHKYGV